MSTTRFQNIVNPTEKGFWRYAKLLGDLPENCRILSHQNEATPLEKVGDFWLKREDLSPTGSHKFRSLIYQLSYLKSKNILKAVLSSSGNAAISASHYAKTAGIQLFTFLSDKTPPEKLAAIQTANLIPNISSKPLRLAKYAIKHFSLPDLRPSQDKNAEIGFETLGFELFEQNPGIQNIFSFATSFASLEGIQKAYGKLLEMGEIQQLPHLYAVMNDGKLAGELSGQPVDNRVDNFDIVYSTDDDILSTRQHILSTQLSTQISNESVASIAAYLKIKPAGESVVISTGKLWEYEEVNLSKFHKAETFADVDKIVAQYA
jgi:threonine synthase